MNEAIGSDAIRIVQNNGADAGQVIFHLHVHVIPMKPQNQFRRELGSQTPEVWKKDAEKIRARLIESKNLETFCRGINLKEGKTTFLIIKAE